MSKNKPVSKNTIFSKPHILTPKAFHLENNVNTLLSHMKQSYCVTFQGFGLNFGEQIDTCGHKDPGIANLTFWSSTAYLVILEIKT